MRDQGPPSDAQRLESLADEFFAPVDVYDTIPGGDTGRLGLRQRVARKNPTAPNPVQPPRSSASNGSPNTTRAPWGKRRNRLKTRTSARPPADVSRTAIRAGRMLFAGAAAVILATLLTQTTAGNQRESVEAGPDQAPQTETNGDNDSPQFIVIDGPQRSGNALRNTLSGFIARFGRGEELTADSGAAGGDTTGDGSSLDYQANLEMIRGATVRNRNHDDSPHVNTASVDLNPENHYGPRSEYLNNPGDNPEQAFPIPAGGQFRAACEFSHFSYDDPLLFPNMPGAAHLHMFFGNTNVNAFSTYDSLVNSGSSTCNGQELNRTGYWVPAMFDGQGNVRIPERVVVYYKGEGKSRGASQPYPEGAAMITHNLNTLSGDQGGSPGKLTFACTDNFSSPSGDGGNTMPTCDGSRYKNEFGVDDNPRVVLEVNIKFPQCWNGQDPANWRNFQPPSGNWYGSNCSGEFNQNFPNLEYFVNYVVDVGEDTSDWFISSDVNPDSLTRDEAGGASIHGDWWGGWHKKTNQTWIDNCVNYASDAASGCGFGYLSDGGPNGGSPSDGAALKMRPQYHGPYKVPAEQLLRELCPDSGKSYAKPEDAAYCAPGTGL